ncbi:tetratricopeptide repeat protein [Lysobacter sp. F6437]|uniref:tetratricopeptide repeat protein n=1 Tax=Lysobacter sp. F6437 TaxID=3459296 RepID=UPI00403E0947
MRDYADLATTGATADSLAAFEQASHELRCYIDDPVASVEHALAASPAMTMAHVLKAWLHLLGTEPAGLPIARDCLRVAEALPANERERGHLRAIGLLLEGRWRAAARTLEDINADYPRDALALQAGHLLDFFTGDARMLRDRIARALPAWGASQPGHHALLGMYAFGLEECGQYAQAERHGRLSVERQPRDGWGWHAVAHVMEMQGRTEDGIAWLGTDAELWSRDSAFAVHNWWHLALFHLELDRIDEALDLFDGPIDGRRSALAMDLIDATSLLWRLHLRGADVGERWETVADRWAPLAGAGHYAFNELHAMMAFVGSGRGKAQRAVLESLETAAATGTGDTAAFAREVGLDAARAMQAFGEARHADAISLLRPLRGHAQRFGGSHAQRDLLDLTLLEAAIRGGYRTLAAALAAERAAQRPESPLNRLFLVRTADPTQGLPQPCAVRRRRPATLSPLINIPGSPP